MVPIELLTCLDTAVVPMSDFILLNRYTIQYGAHGSAKKHTNMHSFFLSRMTRSHDTNVYMHV
jgi:hypothetical protein